MKKLFKALFAGLGALLSLSACSLMPEDYKSGNQGTSCSIEFDSYYYECPLYETGEINIRLLNGNGKYISFNRPSVSCNAGSVVSYDLFNKDSKTWAINFSSTKEIKTTFTVGLWINQDLLRNYFTVNFFNDGGHKTSNDYDIMSNIPDTVFFDTYYARAFEVSLLELSSSELVPFSSIKIECDGLQCSLGYKDYYTKIIDLLPLQTGFIGECTLIVTKDDVEIRKSYQVVIDGFSAEWNGDTTLKYASSNPFTFYLRGLSTGIRRPVSRITIESPNDLVQFNNQYINPNSESPIINLVPNQPYGSTDVYAHVYGDTDIGYSCEFGVNIIEECVFTKYDEYNQVLSPSYFENLKQNSTYVFYVDVTGKYSLMAKTIFSFDFPITPTTYVNLYYVIETNNRVKITVVTLDNVGTAYFRIRAYTSNGEECIEQIKIKLSSN